MKEKYYLIIGYGNDTYFSILNSHAVNSFKCVGKGQQVVASIFIEKIV